MPLRLRVFLVFVLAYFLSFFFRSANAVIAGDLERDLSLSAAQLGLMTSLFFAAFALVQLPLGAALDRYGARRVTPTLMLAGVLGSALFAAAPSFGVLALGRALIGVGMAGIYMGALKALSGFFPPGQFATVSGVFTALGASGALAAATPLAALSSAFGWRAVFWGGAGAVLLSALVISFWGRDAPAEAGFSPTGGFADIFKSLPFWRIALLSLAVVGGLFAYQGLWAGPYLQDALGRSALGAGNLLLLLSGGVVVGYSVVGWVADRFGLVRVMASSAALFAGMQLALAFFQPGWPEWLLGALFAGFGVFGASNLLLYAHARAVFPPHMTGRAVTAVNLFGIGGGALLQWGLGLLIGRFPTSATGAYPPEAYTASFLFTALLCLAAVLFYLPLRRAQPYALIQEREQTRP